ncbi:hypothetical protein HUT18_08100 [Streptomyces sp. NA04227]|uniref:hypothetical protein n=1 Tax=Streptomyces sp. NA04227 TaxID=2742136 RepID=UPI001592887E|nr:hypothetical protein [Streptomyces sp. NA04227]QKW06367.1 hypothetical protein HUT18_08100 [Streptomyces sp. NA04227]
MARPHSTASALAVAFWLLTALSLGWLIFCALNIAFWAVIAGGNPLPLFLLPGGALAAVVAVVAALNAFLVATDLPKPIRLAVLGAVAFPAPMAGALYTLYWIGGI